MICLSLPVYQLWNQFLQEEAAKARTLPIGDPTAPKGGGLEDVDYDRVASPNEEKKRLT